jgi:hypothetical protein
LLAHLRDAGCSLVLWSAGGAEYARQRAEEHGLASYFSGFHDKEGRDDAGRFVTHRFLPTLDAVVFVDDRPEDLPAAAEVVAVAPYLVDNPHDQGLAPARRRAGLAE